MEKIQEVLFVCIHNSARSQMAEAFLNFHGQGQFVAQSAGLEPGQLNPIVVEVMREKGMDISKNRAKSVQEFLGGDKRFDCVITVCDETSAERCPVFPGQVKRLHWGFKDPSALVGTPEEKLAATRLIRDQIEERVKIFVSRATSKLHGKLEP